MLVNYIKRRKTLSKKKHQKKNKTGLSAIALAGVGVGIGNVFGSFLLAAARQPNLMRALFNYAILGFALTEAIGLFALMIAFLMLFA